MYYSKLCPAIRPLHEPTLRWADSAGPSGGRLLAGAAAAVLPWTLGAAAKVWAVQGGTGPGSCGAAGGTSARALAFAG